jgi:hypothetical protein
MQRRTAIYVIVAVVLMIIGSPFALLVLYVTTTGGMGSLREATKLKKIVERIPNPEVGIGTVHEYACKRSKNGEWVLGIARDSHGIMSALNGGGTMVVKDSRGQVRCFLGHVCGSGAQSEFWGTDHSESLDQFYTRLVESFRFVEHKLP